jgi:NTP pyrophosphatase (non-canonical NTP hydrolase)
MNFQDYEDEAAKSDCIPLTGREKLQFLVLGLNEEAGEISRIVKKLIRDDIVEETFLEDVKHKIGDVLWYLCAIARNSNITMSDVAERNLEFLTDRWLTNTGDTPLAGCRLKFYKTIPRNIIFKIYSTIKQWNCEGQCVRCQWAAGRRYCRR